jgi:hypothetical protein
MKIFNYDQTPPKHDAALLPILKILQQHPNQPTKSASDVQEP